ncbi:hypothetical protein ES703_71175 [subsurface metagenome]
MHTPFIARRRAGLRRVAIGSVIAGDNISLFSFRERNVQAIIEKGIGLSLFARLRPCEGQRNLVPLLQLTGNDSFSLAFAG